MACGKKACLERAKRSYLEKRSHLKKYMSRLKENVCEGIIPSNDTNLLKAFGSIKNNISSKAIDYSDIIATEPDVQLTYHGWLLHPGQRYPEVITFQMEYKFNFLPKFWKFKLLNSL